MKLEIQNLNKVTIGFWCDVPKNTPQWLLNLWTDTSKNCFDCEISFNQIIELYNLDIDVMITHGFTGKIIIWLDDYGKRFKIR